MKSIIQDKKGGYCYICHMNGNDYRQRDIEEHHIFYGPNRSLSERYGLKVYLCRFHHQGDIRGNYEAVHNNPDRTTDRILKAAGQRAWEECFAVAEAGTEEAHAEFRAVFGKNYL